MTRFLVAYITPISGQEDHVESLVEQLAQDVRAEAGNIRFEVSRETEGTTIAIVEEYRDDAAFETHISQPHTRAFNEKLKDLAQGGGSRVVHLTPFAQEPVAKSQVRGIDHAGMTVPDIEAATAFFATAFGAKTLYDVQPKDAKPMEGPGPEAQLGLEPGTQITHMRLLQLGKGPSIELLQIAGDQRPPVRLQDHGLTHIAIYVDDIDLAVERFRAAGGTLLDGPHPLAGVEDAKNNAGIYGHAPWGTLIELLTYPGGVDYPAHAPAPRWTPRP